MRLRLTPLNILVASLITYSIFSVWNKQGSTVDNQFYHPACIMGVLVIVDLGFRRLADKLKHIWVMEVAFIIFAALIIVTLSRM